MSYDSKWHQMHGDMTSASARTVLSALHEALPLDTALDVGCGDGRWLEAWCGLGASAVVGVDGPWNDTSVLRFAQTDFIVQDLSTPFDLGRRFDLAISLEVAEHVPPASSQGFVETLTRHADCVLFGAAIPFQGGYRHINERWQSWWVALFAEKNYDVFDPFRQMIWDDPGVHYWYKQNMLLYIQSGREDLKESVIRWMAQRSLSGLPVDIVHPKKYEAIASYDQIAFKPLLRRLPSRVWGKAGQVIRGKI